MDGKREITIGELLQLPNIGKKLEELLSFIEIR
jgi:hypothetical protein